MKTSLFLIAALFSTAAFAADPDLVDVCGTLTKQGKDFYTIKETKTDRIYGISSTDDMSVKELDKLPAGARQCIRGWVSEDKPSTLQLFDHWPYIVSEDIFKCKVREVIDDGVFEEALSVDEYPDVDLERVIESEWDAFPAGLSLGVGANRSYSENDGDSIKVVEGDKFTEATAQYKGDDDKVTIRVSHRYSTRKTKKGVNRYRKGELFYNGDIVAELKCK